MVSSGCPLNGVWFTVVLGLGYWHLCSGSMASSDWQTCICFLTLASGICALKLASSDWQTGICFLTLASSDWHQCSDTGLHGLAYWHLFSNTGLRHLCSDTGLLRQASVFWHWPLHSLSRWSGLASMDWHTGILASNFCVSSDWHYCWTFFRKIL